MYLHASLLLSLKNGLKCTINKVVLGAVSMIPTGNITYWGFTSTLGFVLSKFSISKTKIFHESFQIDQNRDFVRYYDFSKAFIYVK